MNELQIRLSADITALQSALTKAKNTIKSFESETEKESDKGNVGFKRKIGLIEQLTNKAKTLRTALSQATNEQQVERFNQELEQTRSELTRLNALGRSVTANLGSTASGFDRAKGSASQFGVEFNRVIQDAPFAANNFGSIANNIQRLGEVFQQTRSQAGSAGAAIKASLASIISPVNLGLLAVSALTAGFTAYQMGAFDFVTATDEATTAQEEFNESLKDTEQTLKEGFFNELLKAQGLLKTENLGGRLVDVPAFQTADEVLQKLGSTIDGLNKNELEALESFLSQRLADAARASANATTELEKSLANTDVLGYEKVLAKVNEQLKFYESDTKKSTKATKDLKEEISSFSTDPLVDAYFEAIRVGAEFRKSLEEAASGLTGEEGENSMTDIQNQIAASLASAGPPVKEFADQYKVESDRLTETNRAIIDSFGALGTAIAANLDISNDALKGFVSTVLSAAPKVIQALIAQTAAKKAAAAKDIATNSKVAASEGITLATKAANALGPVGLALLPVFIGGVLALISGAFSKNGGGGNISAGGGGISSAGAPPQIFTNSQIPSIPGSPAPSPSGNIDFDRAQGTLTTRVDGGDIVFVYDRYKERQQGGG